MTGSSVTLYYI